MIRTLRPFLVFAVAAAVVPILLRATATEYCLTQLTMSMYSALVVMGLSLLMGFAGQVSLGHAAFFAIGGYTTAVLTTHNLLPFQETAWVQWLQGARLLTRREDAMGGALLTATPWASFGVAMVATFLMAHLIGWPALRLKGHYLAMATLGFGMIVNKIVVGIPWLGAADGITGVPEWDLGWGVLISGRKPVRFTNFYLASGLVLMFLVVSRNLVRSRVGRALQAIHDRETAANAMGIPTAKYRLKIFTASALMAAVAGVFFAHYTGGIGPSEASVLKSVRYVALAAVGGMANLWGVTVMTIAINFGSLRGWFGTYDNAVFGALLILIISVAPEGPLQPLSAWVRRRFRTGRPARPEAAVPLHPPEVNRAKTHGSA